MSNDLDSLTSLAIWKRGTRGDCTALARACINTSGATLFLGGSLEALRGADISSGTLFFIGNVCYVVTGIWWAFATRAEFTHRYASVPTQLIDHDASRPAVLVAGPGSVASRPAVLVAGPGSVAPPFPALPPTLQSQDIIQAFRALCWLDIFSALCQVVGGIVFNVGCCTQRRPDLENMSIAMWAIGSAFFVLQGIIGHIMCTSFIGTWLTLVPRTSHYKRWMCNRTEANQFPECCQPREFDEQGGSKSTIIHLQHACVHKCIPAALLNTVGSILFLVGSLVLIRRYNETSNICFAIGASLFLISNYSDGANIIDELYKRVTFEDKIH